MTAAAKDLSAFFNQTSKVRDLRSGQVQQLLRAAMTGGAAGPGSFETLAIQGTDHVTGWLRDAVVTLG